MRSIYLVIASVLLSSLAQAQSAAGLTYHGRLLKPNGEPVASTVSFKVQILSPGTEQCVLWEETQSQDLTTTAGVFVLHLNGSRSTRTDGGTATFNEVFSNRKVLTPPAGKCAGSATNFDPTVLPAAPRVMRVSFNDGTFTGWEDTEDQAVNYAPKAIDALQVAGYPATSLLRFADSNGTLVNTSPLSNVQYTELLAILDGTSTKYMTTSAGTSTPTGAPSTLAAGKIWLDGTALKFYDGSATQTLGNASSSTQWSTGTDDISYAGKVGIGVTAPTAKFEVKGTTADSTAAAANITNSAGTSALYVRNDGRVGIGTATPTSTLDVAGEVRANSLRIPQGGSLYLYGGTDNSHSIRSSANNMYLTEYGGRFHFYNSQTNLDMMTIGDGKVGIGTTSPAVKLDVVGQIRSVASGGSTKVNSTAAVDWDNGNVQSMTSACTTTAFTNMVDGGSYSLAVTDTSATQCVFSQAGLTFFFTPGNAPRTLGKLTLYSFLRIGTNVFVAWAVMNPS